MKFSYDDIIHLPHHVSTIHPQMSIKNRAAQFSPFAALTGYEAAIKETARQTEARIELDEDSLAELNMKLCALADLLKEQPDILVTHFKKDELKDGGVYVTTSGVIKKINDYERSITLMDGKKIAIEDIIDIKCELFKNLDWQRFD